MPASHDELCLRLLIAGVVEEKLCFGFCLLQESKTDEKVNGTFLPGMGILNISVRVYVFGLDLYEYAHIWMLIISYHEPRSRLPA